MLFRSKSGLNTSDEKCEQDFEWTHRPHMMTVTPIERQEVVVGEQKHKECCIVSEGEWRERHGGNIGCRKVLGEKERSWMTRMTCYDTRGAARKHKCLHHLILGKMKRGGSRTHGFTPRNSVSFRGFSVVCTS